MFVELCGALVLIKQGKPKLLNLLEVIVHMKLHSKHWVQVVYGCFGASKLEDKQGERLAIFYCDFIHIHLCPVLHQELKDDLI